MTNNAERLIERAKREFETRFENGRLVGRSSIREHDGTIPFINVPFHPPPRRVLPRIPRPRRHLDPVPEEPPLSVFRPVDQVRDHDEFEVFDELPEFPDLMDCFSNEGFDPCRFGEFAQNFLRETSESSDEKDHISQKKAKIVSVLAQNLYVMCCLSKEQMKNNTAFWKVMIDFISPESAPTTKRIHASYNTCINEARRRYEAAEQRHREMFRTCVHFSIALDTAQFGQEHFVMCGAFWIS